MEPDTPPRSPEEGNSEALPVPGPEFVPPSGADGSWRRVTFGPLTEPLVPPHPGPPESPEDELAAAALGDPGAGIRDTVNTAPTFWRTIFLLLLAVAALALVFWKR
ncbi:MAG: hypothetical protein HY823_07995 [Acidobacteria bacterium]|nr:hypothetical protein [Acidobacteriota bacterium]